MTEPADVIAQGHPTIDQGRAVYDSMSRPTVRSFHAKMIGLGYDISQSCCQRWMACRFKRKTPPRICTAAATIDATEEVDLIAKEMAELQALEVSALKALMEKERLIYNIMVMRFSQRSADKLALAPQASAVLIKAMAEADVSISHIPVGHLSQLANGHLIDITPNEQNEVSSAIGLFLKQEGVAA